MDKLSSCRGHFHEHLTYKMFAIFMQNFTEMCSIRNKSALVQVMDLR